ncbi:AI-2E family transporter [Hydrococcus rivularis NIES-593]|uniref:AI-2E family transporter n=1 Tax=Hydrococcus rivularis NIES-593 TaxID=1921803 RepID=A0A1U7HMW5_9CYAN|nr:AI-2E family transporter [Hydrococcus rivularis NIES-593]
MKFGQWLGVVAIGIALYIMWQIRQILLLLFAAIVLANALNILVKRQQKWGIKRSYAVAISGILLMAASIGFFWLVVPPFVNEFQQLVQLVPQGIEESIAWLEELGNRLDPELIRALPTIEQLTQQLQPLVNQIAGRGLSFFYTSLGIPLSLVFLLVLTFMLLADPHPYRQGFIRLFPSFYRRRVDEILIHCDRALNDWLAGICFNMLAIALLSFVGLSVLQIPLALSQATIAGLFAFIPTIGPALSVVPPMAIALLDDPWKALAVLIFYIVMQQVETQVLTRLILKHHISVFPAITLLAQLFFATVFGFLGLFLAFPLIIVGQVWLKEVLIEDILDRWKAGGVGRQEEEETGGQGDKETRRQGDEY